MIVDLFLKLTASGVDQISAFVLTRSFVAVAIVAGFFARRKLISMGRSAIAEFVIIAGDVRRAIKAWLEDDADYPLSVWQAATVGAVSCWIRYFAGAPAPLDLIVKGRAGDKPLPVSSMIRLAVSMLGHRLGLVRSKPARYSLAVAVTWSHILVLHSGVLLLAGDGATALATATIAASLAQTVHRTAVSESVRRRLAGIAHCGMGVVVGLVLLVLGESGMPALVFRVEVGVAGLLIVALAIVKARIFRAVVTSSPGGANTENDRIERFFHLVVLTGVVAFSATSFGLALWGEGAADAARVSVLLLPLSAALTAAYVRFFVGQGGEPVTIGTGPDPHPPCIETKPDE